MRKKEHLWRRSNGSASSTIVLTALKRAGTAVPTPVNIALGDDPTKAYFRTWMTAGKAKRIRNNNRVTVAPSTFRGKVTGATTHAEARLLHGVEDGEARRLLRRKYPILHGILVPFGHKLQRVVTCHYALTAVNEPAG